MPASPPIAVVVCGLPGAGKTRLARLLAQRFGLERVSRDELRWTGAADDQGPDLAKRAAFERLLRRLEASLRAGNDVVVEGMPFSRQREHAAVAEVAERCDAATCTLWLDCPLELARRRVAADLAAAVHPASDRRPALVDEVAARWQSPPDAVRLDASQPSEDVLAQALDALAPRLRRT